LGKYRVLVVGGGIGGMASAIRFKEDGHDVELIDLSPLARAGSCPTAG